MENRRVSMLSNGRQPYRVLVVEDEYYLADDLSRTLENYGAYVIGPVATVDEAERLVGSETIDCAVIDMNLIGDTTFCVADRLERAGIPYVIASGYSSETLPERFAGKPYVEKPFEPEQVAAMLPDLMKARLS